ncbi:restriction endonuclease [Flavobacterium sp. AG291]|uniref:restriction endonuclease n=1 Tax=Flavobacterium sp. AG291 TaxID=2184000 RepID=UPI000E0C7F6D|nr:restriction endonuclease [Flavobacterium sp. AG291]
MAADGKFLEKLVNIVEEVYRSSPGTEILRNYKITNVDGAKREFDLIITSQINGYTITIAIECKQYSKKVSVDKIEAFYGKCQGIPQIDKKIFVAENGFQQGALDTAKRCGIELYTFAEIGQRLRETLQVNRVKPVFKRFEILSVGCECDGELPEIPLEDVTVFHSVNGRDTYNYYELLIETARPEAAILNYTALFNHFKDHQTSQKVNFKALLTGIYFIYNDTRIYVRQIECNAVIDIELSDMHLIENTYMAVNQDEPKATTLSFDLDNKVTGSIVMDKDEKLHFFDTTGNEINKLEVMLEYDTASGQFKKPARP